uniref:Uncharacterized protein n=1 Tax=Anguilla anguilla TaxID=7936 RepID=A0A0E9PMC5_ANGAN
MVVRKISLPSVFFGEKQLLKCAIYFKVPLKNFLKIRTLARSKTN